MQGTDIKVIVPNLKRRLSGVTATIVRLVPMQAEKIGIVATGPGLPNHVPHISLTRVMFLRRKTRRVWHARRNTEMLLGLILKHILRKNIALLFTSASQRVHTGYTGWLINRMDSVIATSAKGKSYLKVPATVVMHGIDTTSFFPPNDRAALRQNLGLPTGQIVGCFGRIRHQKGTDVFVDAMLEVLKTNRQATAIILGRATASHQQFEADLRAKIAKNNLSERLRILPEVPVNEIADWYRTLDLFVAPQRWEGFGLTPLEAMACGVPVIATDVGAFEELVVPGDTGQIIPRGDVMAMSGAINIALTDAKTLAKQGKAARGHVVENFSIKREAASLIQSYKALLT